MRAGLITFTITLILDQLSKWFVVLHLDLANRYEIDVLPPLLTFRMAWNRGVNFGLFSGPGNHWILIAIALVVTGLVIWWVRRETDVRVMIATGLLAGGAIGNVVDRVLYGAVADFLNMSCCGIRNPYSFNVADIAVFLGAIGLVFWTGRAEKG